MLARNQPQVDVGLHDADQYVRQVVYGDGGGQAAGRGFFDDEIGDQGDQPGFEVGRLGGQQAQGQVTFAVEKAPQAEVGDDGTDGAGDDSRGRGLTRYGRLASMAVRFPQVQGNISAFGGDPARVTVAGESAGAMSVTTLLSMPLAEGLFARAVAESGAAAHTLTKDEGRMVGGYLADVLGVPPDRESIKAIPLDKLVQAASDLVVEVQTTPDPGRWGQLTLSLLPFAPTVDGSVLPAAPLASIATGQGGHVPLLIGSNRDEARPLARRPLAQRWS